MKYSAATIALGLAIAMGVRHDAGAQTMPPVVTPLGNASPVTINSCTVIPGQGTGPSIGGIQLAQSSAGIAIQFVNESTKTADLVNFAVDSNGQHFVIRDIGKFSPGVSIKHRYSNGAGQSFILPAFISPKLTCHVASVRFTDGSTWEHGQRRQAQEAPESGSVLKANPTSLTLRAGGEADLFTISAPGPAAFKEINNCTNVATVAVAATGESTAVYSVRPLAAGTCAAHIIDEEGHTLAIPITVR